MSSSISEKVAGVLIKNKTIRVEEKDLYVYGIQQGLFFLLNLATSVSIGMIFSMFWETIIFMLSYLPLRSYAGGYHAKTPLWCYILSIFLIVLTLWAIIVIPLNGVLYLTLGISSSIIIVVLSPVEDKNKPLDSLEKSVYKKRSIILLCVMILISIILWVTGLQRFCASVLLGLMVLAVMLILGKLKLTYNY